MGIGLADASIAVLAERYGCREVLTLDHHHFRALRFSRRRSFRILPDDL
jgi:predicted nucleic acid-binding protein